MRHRSCQNCGSELGRSWRWCGDCLRMLGKTFVTEAIGAAVAYGLARWLRG